MKNGLFRNYFKYFWKHTCLVMLLFGCQNGFPMILINKVTQCCWGQPNVVPEGVWQLFIVPIEWVRCVASQARARHIDLKNTLVKCIWWMIHRRSMHDATHWSKHIHQNYLRKNKPTPFLLLWRCHSDFGGVIYCSTITRHNRIGGAGGSPSWTVGVRPKQALRRVARS